MRPSPRRRRQPSSPSTLEQETYEVALFSREPRGEAVLALRATMSLADLHGLIAGRLSYPAELPYTFTVKQGDAEVRFGPGDTDPRSLLGGLDLHEGGSLRYECPAGEVRWELIVGVLSVETAQEGIDYPSVISWELPFPADHPGARGESGGEGLDDDGFDDDDYEGEDEEGEELIPLDEDLIELENEIDEALNQHDYETEEGANKHLDAHLALALKTIELTAPRPLQFAALCDGLNCDLADWVWNLFHDLAELGRHEQALDMLARMEGLLDVFPETRAPRASIFVGLGRTDEARALTEALLKDGEDPEQRFLAAQGLALLVELGELTRAEALAHQLRRERDVAVQADAMDALATIYRRTGRKREARKADVEAAKLQERAFRENLNAEIPWWIELRDEYEGHDHEGHDHEGHDHEGHDHEGHDHGPTLSPGRGAASEPAPGVPVRNAMPKVGRNDPCPCGNGKKYKKCHGA